MDTAILLSGGRYGVGLSTRSENDAHRNLDIRDMHLHCWCLGLIICWRFVIRCVWREGMSSLYLGCYGGAMGKLLRVNGAMLPPFDLVVMAWIYFSALLSRSCCLHIGIVRVNPLQSHGNKY